MPRQQNEGILPTTSCARAFVQLFLLFMLFSTLPRELLAQVTPELCGPIAAGVVDYRLPKGNHVNQVEGAHFPPHVELWTRGNRGPLGADIDYTLLHIPNHHRALISIARRAEQLKKYQLPNTSYPVECYFERAIRYKADDHVAHMLYARFLIVQTRPAEAAKQLEYVANMTSDNGFTLYNIGLLYADMKDYTQALAYAHKALALGFERPELRKRLEAAGRWTEPVANSAEPAPSSATAPPAHAASADAPEHD